MEQLGTHFKKIAGPLLKRHGLAYADLLAAWDEIIGPELCQHCLPEKYSPPRANKSGGQLILRARFGRALDVQYRGVEIIEKINRFCGFHAVASLKVLQGALPEVKAPTASYKLDEEIAAHLDRELNLISDARLKTALSRLGQGVLKRD